MASFQSKVLRYVVKYYIARSLRAEKPLQEQRDALERLEKIALSSPFSSIKKVDAGGCQAELIQHKNARSTHAILYIHGGGFTTGSPSTHRLIAERLSYTARAMVLLIDYRLAPEHPYPAGLDDCVNAYQWLLKSGYSPRNLAVAGDSAGGGLCLSTLLRLKDAYSPLPSSAVLFSPWVDLTMSGNSIVDNAKKESMLSVDWMQLMARHYAKDNLKDPLCSPLFADLSGLPPVLIQVDSSEVLLADATRLAEKLHNLGNNTRINIWHGLWHVWQTFVKFLPEANEAVGHAGEFIQEFWPEQQ
ncbi:MAG: alpha/beta hydrolase [Hahellaceae bacterium]|jgi:acetyl esterase/lipase|nr:alpha/beta hydrolase [Hahellaceae bacterium]MCP5211556.1 alpha/beta hydrolase [Hahellaceae bacterium]